MQTSSSVQVRAMSYLVITTRLAIRVPLPPFQFKGLDSKFSPTLSKIVEAVEQFLKSAKVLNQCCRCSQKNMFTNACINTSYSNPRLFFNSLPHQHVCYSRVHDTPSFPVYKAQFKNLTYSYQDRGGGMAFVVCKSTQLMLSFFTKNVFTNALSHCMHA